MFLSISAVKEADSILTILSFWLLAILIVVVPPADLAFIPILTVLFWEKRPYFSDNWMLIDKVGEMYFLVTIKSKI